MTSKTHAGLSLLLILALTTSASPVIAEEPAQMPRSFDFRGPAPGTGPLVRAATREAVRLAATPDERTMSTTESVEQGSQSGPSDWSRVRQLAPHTELIVTVTGAPSVHGYFVAADDSELMVSNGAVVQIERDAIGEISHAVPYSPRHDVLVGLGLGAAIGGGLYLALCHGFGGCGAADVGPLLGTAALFAGISAGIAVLPGGRHARHGASEIIYRAP